MHSGSLAVCAIGQGLAAARSVKYKHAVKQVDRLLSNPAIDVDAILERWVPYIVGNRSSIVVALDWTDFDGDSQSAIMLSLITDRSRATPLVSLTVDKGTLKNNRSLYRAPSAPPRISVEFRQQQHLCGIHQPISGHKEGAALPARRMNRYHGQNAGLLSTKTMAWEINSIMRENAPS